MRLDMIKDTCYYAEKGERAMRKHKDTSNDAIIVPAGKYWVGDPCYAIKPHDLWMDVVNDIFNNDIATFLNSKGEEVSVCAFSTKYGDGVYYDQFGREYPVDAGLIGIVSASVENKEPFGMHLIEFDQDFVATEVNGLIMIGGIRINTDDEEDEYEECW